MPLAPSLARVRRVIPGVSGGQHQPVSRVLTTVASLVTVAVGVSAPAAADQSVRTQSGNTRCEVNPNTVVCQYLPGFAQAPVDPPINCPPPPGTYGHCTGPAHWDLATVTSSGQFRWDEGNIPGGPSAMASDLVLNYGHTYNGQGWTIAADEQGTRFTNDATGHGMFVSIDNVSAF